MTDWTSEEQVFTDWFGNVLNPPIIGLLLEEAAPSALLLEGSDQLLLES